MKQTAISMKEFRFWVPSGMLAKIEINRGDRLCGDSFSDVITLRTIFQYHVQTDNAETGVVLDNITVTTISDVPPVSVILGQAVFAVLNVAVLLGTTSGYHQSAEQNISKMAAIFVDVTRLKLFLCFLQQSHHKQVTKHKHLPCSLQQSLHKQVTKHKHCPFFLQQSLHKPKQVREYLPCIL